MKKLAAVLCAGFITHNATAQTCSASGIPAVRIEYEAHMPSHVIAMASRSEVQRAFPGVNGITERTVFVTAERVVTIERGRALRRHVVRPPAVAPGVHLGDGRAVLTWIGYEEVPLLIKKIESRQEKVSYNSVSGRARRTSVTAPDTETRALLESLESDQPDLGERTYAGMRCRARAMPILGARTEACVVFIQGWPIALAMQLGGSDVNWYRATRIDRTSCLSAAEMALPPGVRLQSGRRSGRESADAEGDDEGSE